MVNFRKIGSFLMFLCCLKTNAKAKEVSFTLKSGLIRAVRKVGVSKIKNVAKCYFLLLHNVFRLVQRQGYQNAFI